MRSAHSARGCLSFFHIGLLITAFLLLAGMFPRHVFAAQPQRLNILILHSYHVGYKWTDELHAGILSALAQSGSDLAFHVEYMDMKRYFSEDRYELLYRTLKDKYAFISIDYVISSDDAALIFLKKYATDLFPEAIVAFCGANYFDESELAGYPNFFGVTEEADIEENILTLRKIHPDTERIYIINDTTVTGLKVKKEVDRVAAKYSNIVDLIVLDDLSLDELLEQIETIPPNSLVLFSLFFRDRYDQTFEYYDVISMVYDRSPVPIYGLWDFYFGHGLVGGMVTNAHSQGKTAGNIVTRLISDGPSAEIPRVYHSPNLHIFDYNLLMQYGINPGILPADSLVLNFPVSFYQKHKQVLIGSAAAIFILLCIILLLATNIYLRRVAERRLRQSEANYRSIFENASEGMFQTTRDGKFIRVNPSLARMLRCESTEDVLINYSDIRNQLYVRPEERDQMFEELALKKRIINRERQVYCKDGSIITVLQNLHEIYDESGTFLYLEGSLTDITEQKATESKLRQAQKMEAIGTLAGGIAHDFNNILSALSGYNQLALLESEPESKLHGYLREVNKASKRARDLVSQILTISRKTESEKRPLQVRLIVKEALKLLRSSIPSFIEIVQDIRSDERIVADSTEIHQVVMNLCTNAYHAMKETGGTLSISLQDVVFSDSKAVPDPGFPQGKYLRLEISDTGIGMDEQTQAKIFEPYFTTKAPGTGTGLGLAVVNGIVTGNGGFIRVYSEPGHGSTFNLYFPVAADTGKQASQSDQETQKQIIGGKEALLVIDDEENVLNMHTELLEKHGYTVDGFSDSVKALECFHAHPSHYAMVITDLTMPGLSGTQLKSEIHTIRPELPVIIVSGFSGAMNRARFISEGYADFIQKPVDIYDFMNRIREILDNTIASLQNEDS